MKKADGLRLMAHCPHCRHPYKEEDARIVDRLRKETVYHIHCAHCSHAMMLLLRKRERGLACAGVFTDCSFEDALRFKDAEKVTVNDVLEVHEGLKLDNFLEIG